MTKHKYVGMDVHSATTVIDVQNEHGKTTLASTIETRSEEIKDYIRGLTGTIHVTFEEGVHAAWLYEMIKPLVAEVVVCDPRHNKLIQSGNKSDRNDARKLAELLRLGSLKGVYHGDCGTRSLREAVRAYNVLTRDCLRVMNRVKAMYRGGASTAGGPRSIGRYTGTSGWNGLAIRRQQRGWSCCINNWMPSASYTKPPGGKW